MRALQTQKMAGQRMDRNHPEARRVVVVHLEEEEHHFGRMGGL